MTRQLLLVTSVFIFGCARESASEVEIKKDNVPGLIPDELMSEGNELDLGSRYVWEWQRRANPNTGKIPPNIRQKELEFAQRLPVNTSRDLSWTHRGPVNVGGRTRAIAIDVLNENIWLAGGVTGGIWRSTDAGQNWIKVTNPLDVHSITAIVQDTRPGKENIWYAGTGENYGIVSHTTFEARFSGNGILKSTDNGLTWSGLTSTQSNTPQTYVQNGDMDFVWRIVTDPSDMANDVVLAAVFNGIMYSNDGGDTWTESIGFTPGTWSNPGCKFADLVVSPTGVFYTSLSSDGVDKGIYRSEDGLNWADITPGTMPGTYGRMAIAFNPLDENEVWFFGNTSGGYANGHSLFHYNYISGDGTGAGGSWSERSAYLPDYSCQVEGITTDLAQLSTQSSFDVHLAVHPTDPDVIYIAGTSIWRNTDGFTHDSTNKWIGGYKCDTLSINDLNWSLSYPNHHPDQHYLMFLPSDPNVMINVNDGGIYKTMNDLQDSIEWVPLNNGYITSQFYAVAIEPGETTSDIVIGGLQDNGTWFTNTTEIDTAWKFIGSGDGMFCALTPNAEYYVTCKQRGKMYLKQIDANGNVLNHRRIDPEDGPSTYNWCNSLKMDANDPNRLYWNGRTRIWRLDDVSQIPLTGDKIEKLDTLWVKMEETFVVGAGIITDIEVAKGGPNRLWYGTNSGKVYRVDNAHSSGATTTEITGDDFPFNAYVASVSVNPFVIDEIVVTFANYGIPSVFYTNDGGLTWTDISGNLEENPDGSGSGPACSWAELYPDGTIFIGTSVGLLTTTYPDGQNTVWTLEQDIGNVVINHMDYRTFDGKMVVATHGQGVYSTNLTPAYVGMEKYAGKDEISVFPSIASDHIKVIAEEADQISIYDLNARLVYKGMPNGNTTQVDVSGFDPGMYFVVVRKGEQRMTRKFVKR